jgi:uncharacterized protein (TIGR03066 family)
MRYVYLGLLACLIAAPAGCNNKPVELPSQNQLGDRIVGAWEVTKAGSYAPQGSTYEFGKDGKLKITITVDDKSTVTDWNYTITGDKLNLIGQVSAKAVLEDDKLTDADRVTVKEVLKIEKLTDGELVTVDATGETGIVTGFTYKCDSPIKSVYIEKPLRNGQKTFELVIAGKTYPLVAGKRFFVTTAGFPNGVTEFIIQGIDESEGLVYEPGEIERTRSARPTTDRPLGHHHRGSFPTGVSAVKEGAPRPAVVMAPILKRTPTEYKRKDAGKTEPASKAPASTGNE